MPAPIERRAVARIEAAFRVNPIVGLLGPRQSGKSTLARLFGESVHKGSVWYFDLEDPKTLARLEEPDLALGELDGLIVIDEIQKRPRLFEYLRVLVDRKQRKLRVLVLGSASRDLIRQSSESLAGRISYVELPPFGADEVAPLERLHIRGGFPLSFLATSEAKSYAWREAYIATFLERDLFDFGYRVAPATIRRFWMMLAHYHGQVLNFSELARSFGVSDMTARKYVEILAETFMIRVLSPWHENLSKRQVKAPKLYFRDSGVLHALLGIEDRRALITHPKLGASWEGFALEQVLRMKGHRAEECYFWSTHNQSDLDLLVFEHGRRIGYEFKFRDVPRVTPSMRIVVDDLRLDHLFVVTPKAQPYPIAEKISARGLPDLVEESRRLRSPLPRRRRLR